MALATGCSQGEAEPSVAVPTTAETEAQTQAFEESKVPEETTKAEVVPTIQESSGGSGYKIGLSVISSMTSSKEAGEEDGTAQVDSIVAAVVVDEQGKIVSCYLDTAQNQMGFIAEGKVVMTEELQTKRELGDQYGMRAASGIGKEWYEQAANMEAYLIGKTAEGVTGIAVNEDQKPTDPDLAAGVTVSISGYQTAAVKAIKNAK